MVAEVKNGCQVVDTEGVKRTFVCRAPDQVSKHTDGGIQISLFRSCDHVIFTLTRIGLTV